MDKIERQVVFVLGAGASVAYGFPTGRGLQDSILRCKTLPSDSTLNLDDFRAFQSELVDNVHDSVDAFLETRRDLEQIGKRVIAEWLIRCEDMEQLRQPPNGPDWYKHFFNTQVDGLAFDHLPSQPYSFITFNYDRSLEAAIHRFVRAKFRGNKTEQEIDGMCTAILLRRVVHVHGSLGAIDWDIRKDKPSRPYSTTVTPEAVECAMSQIKIMHEASDDEFRIAREVLAYAERVYFVGFGYHEDNIRRLYNGHGWRPNISITGTGCGLSLRDQGDALSHFPPGSPFVTIWPKNYDIIRFLDSLQDL
jgi:hypothetical protein